ncbi:Z ring-associated protein ZapA [Gallibacterium anatis]|uniref:Cell division protein ZapA n=1 Tax=Gallibacterium anatis TaxID=750 RepID=A0A377H337_9PAST|nr:cell division protein ZapA [Gallibacterium anatis]KGQ57577.1 cell division protein ZapA [Gallibacterium anatis DSM 16844 = F 149]STO36931.1 Z ring-associated protein ZapA [Gallibacterium anatis]
MSKNIDLYIFGQNLRLSCPEDQQQALREAAEVLEKKVSELKNRAGIIQLDKALTIVGLNLCYELLTQQQQNSEREYLINNKIEQIEHSLSTILSNMPTRK